MRSSYHDKLTAYCHDIYVRFHTGRTQKQPFKAYALNGCFMVLLRSHHIHPEQTSSLDL